MTENIAPVPDFDRTRFLEQFTHTPVAYTHSIAIDAPVDTVLHWVDPHQTKLLHPLIIGIDFRDTGDDKRWSFKVTDQLKMLGFPLKVTYSTEALVIYDPEGSVQIWYDVDQPPGVRLFEIWTIRPEGAHSILSEDVRIRTSGVMGIFNNYIRQQAHDSHIKMFENIKAKAEQALPN